MVDLRPSVNFAADYMLFNALGPGASFISWRPWVVEDPSLSSKSALFPGFVKRSTAITLELAENILDGKAPPSARRFGSISQSKASGGSVADFCLWGERGLVDISSVASASEARALLGESGPYSVAHAVLEQCFDTCSSAPRAPGTITVLLPSVMQCWRVTAPLVASSPPGENSLLLNLCASAWGVEANPGTCAAILRAVGAATAELRATHGSGTQILMDSPPDPFFPIVDADPFSVLNLDTLQQGITSEILAEVADGYAALGDLRTAQGLRWALGLASVTSPRGSARWSRHLALRPDLEGRAAAPAKASHRATSG